MTSASHDTPWEKIPAKTRNRMVWGIWLITWLGLLAGLLERVYWEYVVFFSATHALLILLLLALRVSAFPVQVRLAYFAWVAIGTYVPFMEILMYISILGLPICFGATVLWQECCIFCHGTEKNPSL